MTQVTEVLVSEILSDDEFNCRGRFSPLDCVELARDIQDKGLTQPIVIRPYKGEGYKYVIVVGHRRFLAVAMVNKSETISAIIREINDEDATFINFSENLQRQNLDIVQEGMALTKMVELRGYTIPMISKRTEKSVPWVTVRLALIQLPPEIQEEARQGNISQHHIKRIARFRTKEEQFAAVRKIKEQTAGGKKLGQIEVGHKPPQPDKKTARKPHEIQIAIDWCLEEFGEGLHTYFLSWAAGTISNLELMSSIKGMKREAGVDWPIPLHAEIPTVGKIKIPNREAYV